MDYQVTVRYLGGAERRLRVAPGQTVLEAAEAGGVAIVSECQSGICGTCVGACTSGRYTLGRCEGLSDVERAAGKVLTCQTTVQSDCVIDLQYPLTANAAHRVCGTGRVARVERVSPGTALLTVDASELGEPVAFQPGQFAQLRVPGSDQWRSYSYANRPNTDNELEFIVRLLPKGAMSDWLRAHARPGDAIELRASRGGFHLRPVTRPVLLIAGGTGLSAILSMLLALCAQPLAQPVTLLYGVTRAEDFCKLDVLDALVRRTPGLTVRRIATEPGAGWIGPVGAVTDLLDAGLMNGGEVDLYLCGPGAMVDAVRDWVARAGLQRAGLHCEKFVASGPRRAAAAAFDPKMLDLPQIARAGRGTAVVIGGSIGGIATAKILSERFARVIVLEQDAVHDRRDGRPGAAQGWHLHHLLTAGQQEMERLFPGILDDLVREGAFKVDMAEQYRLRLAGSWKKVCKGGVEIICAGRPLIEWCLRRRLDALPNLEYRYESEAVDLVHDAAAGAVRGVVVEHGGAVEVIPAEFVVDASGKGTRLPEVLERLGYGAPELEQDILNCFYSSMMVHVPPERRWQDKVSVICYAYRPHEQTYAAQYYIDQSRTILLTSLIEYNSYTPPRSAEEFLDFARRMQSPVVAENIEGLMPASPVFNFRSPRMQRYHYEKMARLPRGIVALGDAYTATDPVAGLGMTITLQQVACLRALLAKFPADSAELPRRHFRAIARIGDRAWFVVREQTLRYDWIQDVDKKRPFYFKAMNWYMDRVTELVHDDLAAYRKFLAVIHMVAPPMALFSPVIVGKTLGKWALTRLAGRKTLIERNYGNRPQATAGTPLVAAGLPERRA